MAATVKSDVLLSTQTAGAVFRVPVIDTNLAAAISHYILNQLGSHALCALWCTSRLHRLMLVRYLQSSSARHIDIESRHKDVETEQQQQEEEDMPPFLNNEQEFMMLILIQYAPCIRILTLPKKLHNFCIPNDPSYWRLRRKFDAKGQHMQRGGLERSEIERDFHNINRQFGRKARTLLIALIQANHQTLEQIRIGHRALDYVYRPRFSSFWLLNHEVANALSACPKLTHFIMQPLPCNLRANDCYSAFSLDEILKGSIEHHPIKTQPTINTKEKVDTDVTVDCVSIHSLPRLMQKSVIRVLTQCDHLISLNIPSTLVSPSSQLTHELKAPRLHDEPSSGGIRELWLQELVTSHLLTNILLPLVKASLTSLAGVTSVGMDFDLFHSYQLLFDVGAATASRSTTTIISSLPTTSTSTPAGNGLQLFQGIFQQWAQRPADDKWRIKSNETGMTWTCPSLRELHLYTYEPTVPLVDATNLTYLSWHFAPIPHTLNIWTRMGKLAKLELMHTGELCIDNERSNLQPPHLWLRIIDEVATQVARRRRNTGESLTTTTPSDCSSSSGDSDNNGSHYWDNLEWVIVSLMPPILSIYYGVLQSHSLIECDITTPTLVALFSIYEILRNNSASLRRFLIRYRDTMMEGDQLDFSSLPNDPNYDRLSINDENEYKMATESEYIHLPNLRSLILPCATNRLLSSMICPHLSYVILTGGNLSRSDALSNVKWPRLGRFEMKSSVNSHPRVVNNICNGQFPRLWNVQIWLPSNVAYSIHDLEHFVNHSCFSKPFDLGKHDLNLTSNRPFAPSSSSSSPSATGTGVTVTTTAEWTEAEEDRLVSAVMKLVKLATHQHSSLPNTVRSTSSKWYEYIDTDKLKKEQYKRDIAAATINHLLATNTSNPSAIRPSTSTPPIDVSSSSSHHQPKRISATSQSVEKLKAETKKKTSIVGSNEKKGVELKKRQNRVTAKAGAVVQKKTSSIKQAKQPVGRPTSVQKEVTRLGGQRKAKMKAPIVVKTIESVTLVMPPPPTPTTTQHDGRIITTSSHSHRKSDIDLGDEVATLQSEIDKAFKSRDKWLPYYYSQHQQQHNQWVGDMKMEQNQSDKKNVSSSSSMPTPLIIEADHTSDYYVRMNLPDMPPTVKERLRRLLGAPLQALPWNRSSLPLYIADVLLKL